MIKQKLLLVPGEKVLMSAVTPAPLFSSSPLPPKTITTGKFSGRLVGFRVLNVRLFPPKTKKD